MAERNLELADELEAEIRSYVAAYTGALWHYVTGGKPIDYDALGYWKFPILMIGGAGESCSVTIHDEASFDAMVKPGYEHYLRDGWDGRVEVHQAKATLAGPAIGLVESAGSRYRADGSVNSSWSCTYLLQRTARGWKHIGVDAGLPPRAVAQWGAWLNSVAAGGRG